jgi:dolichol-phosphate mannosyltransferase
LSKFDRAGPPAHLLLGELTGLDADGRQRLRSGPRPLRPFLASRFAVVGASGLVINQALLWSAVAIGHLHYVVGAILATQGSTTWNFLLVDRWVFPERKARSARLRYLAFSGVNNLTLLLRVPMLAVLVSLLHVHYLASNAITLVVLFVGRFVVSDRLIWRTPAKAPAKPPAGPGRYLAPSRQPHTHTQVHRYDVAGVVAIESEVALPELGRFATATAALEQPADITIRIGAVGGRGRRPRPRGYPPPN